MPRLSWRTEIRGAGVITVLAGAWLVGSPFVLSYARGDPTGFDVVVGCWSRCLRCCASGSPAGARC